MCIFSVFEMFFKRIFFMKYYSFFCSIHNQMIQKETNKESAWYMATIKGTFKERVWLILLLFMNRKCLKNSMELLLFHTEKWYWKMYLHKLQKIMPKQASAFSIERFFCFTLRFSHGVLKNCVMPQVAISGCIALFAAKTKY